MSLAKSSCVRERSSRKPHCRLRVKVGVARAEVTMPSNLTRIAHGFHNKGSVVPFHIMLASVKCMLGHCKNFIKKM